MNGVFDGIPPDGDDSVTNFDTKSQGVNDPEGIVFNDNGFLYVVGEDSTLLTEFKLSGEVVRTCDISAAAGIKPAGLSMAPGSENPSFMNLYIVDRGIDNSEDPNENDGRLFEMSIPPLINLTPTVDAGSSQTVILPATAYLDGFYSDDGLPDPPALITSTWTQQSGPATATIVNPDTEDTTVVFPLNGTYVFRLTADDSLLSDFDDVTVTVLPAATQTTTLSIPINLDSDDAEEKPDGKVIIRSTDLDLVRSGGEQTVGLRFNGVSIPQNATIVDAYIQFNAHGLHSEATSLTLAGEATDNAATFVNNIAGNISTRPRTTASVSWPLIPAWTVIGEADLDQRTPDLTPIIQEIVNRTNWVSNNSLAMIITGTGKREAHSFEANALAAPMLFVEFSNEAGNQPPTASITAPADGSSFTLGETINFSGFATDAEDDDAVVTANLDWSSSIDGAIGTGDSFSTTLSLGTHTITATATDSGLLTGMDAITVTVNPVGNTAPTASITTPTDGSSFTLGETINFSGFATDTEDDDAVITANLDWSSSIDGAIGTGDSFSTTLSLGTHTIVATATDSGLLTGMESITVTVDPAGNTAPTASITTPADGSSFTLEETINFSGFATDAEDDDTVITANLDWTSSIDGSIGTGDSFSTTLSLGTHTITATATDNGLLTGMDAITVAVDPVGNTAPTASITTPTDGSSFTLAETISFSGFATDAEDDDAVVTANLDWTSSIDGSIGTGDSFSTTLSLGTHTITATATDSGLLTGIESITLNVLPAGGGTTTLSILINFDSDDAEEKPNGNVVIRSSDLDLVRSGGEQTVGLRFNGVSIPQNATIVDAYIQFNAHGLHSEATSLTLAGEATDNAATFVNNIAGNISTRPRTTASVSWPLIPAWTVIGEADLDQRTPDLTSIIQEIVNRTNWVSNNSLAMIITGTGKREANSFEANALAAPMLFVEFSNEAGNQPPIASITAPADGSSFTLGETINFSGFATDTEDDDAVVTANLDWTSSIDGAIGTGDSFSTTLSLGTHTITATATDSGLLTGMDAITVTVNPVGNTAPTASITAPADGSSFTLGETINFSGFATDAEDDDAVVTANLDWSSSIDGAIGTGDSFSTTLSLGTHTITATATDSGLLTGMDAITVTVNPVGNTAPTASITTPTDGSSFTLGETINFSGFATDTEDDDAVITANLDWSSSIDGGTGDSFSTTLSLGHTPLSLRRLIAAY